MAIVKTETGLREEIITRLREPLVAQGSLGFQNPSGNIRGYLLENEASELTAEYLSATVGGKTVARAIGVQVTAGEVPFAAGLVNLRTYFLLFRIYAEIGIEGEGEIWIVDASRALRNVLRLMGTDLAGYGDLTQGDGRLAIRKQIYSVENDTGALLVGEMQYQAQSKNPEY